ncbi:MAG: hypothetical protein HKN57_12740 [Xanthomonadales bacterium]|nr:hypothetical protein [Gammaproteobacteria bacterium]MBT8054603.1 hypothetical protein [Gammaproteobacteria bacterium]NND58105.1 hypothetical protein [Xanthomonadales bacterium]NNK50378.1 hypothetical protein [Xanthomonadales bacterium]
MKEKLDEAETQVKNLAHAAKHKKPGTARGIETLFRSAYRVQMDLTGLADNKANMMISINGIIISIIIAAVAPKLDSNPWLLVPATVFLCGTLISIVYAILAARPRVSTTSITLEDLEHSEGNILFFGDFANLTQDDFTEGMMSLMEDKTLVYETMIRNLYGLGAVLRKKFALLKWAYNAFMAALILGVGSFIGVFIWILKSAPSG